MLSQISSYKDGATYHPLFSFPSLSADMYQQSSMRAALSGSITQNSDWITKENSHLLTIHLLRLKLLVT